MLHMLGVKLTEPQVNKDLEGHSSDLVLYFYKVGGLSRGRFEKRMVKKSKQ